MSGLINNHGVSNNSTHRGISDKLDDKYFKDHPKQRAVVHGLYHGAVGVAKKICGNKEGAQAEHKRASEQFKNARKPSPR